MIETKFYVVPTPIGNIKDISLRALDVLNTVDEILAEDTRKALTLLSHYNIKKKVTSYHKDNEKKNIESILKKINNGLKLALISEAGTPCISDPGYFLIKELIKEGIKFEVLPGATAFVPALILSGFPSNHFFFYGFLNHKKNEKIKELDILKSYKTTIILYESPHRITDTLTLLFDFFNPPFAVIREITKLYEERIFINNRSDINNLTLKGEFVIVIDNNTSDDLSQNYDYQKICTSLFNEGFDKKDIMKILKVLGLKRNDAYQLLESFNNIKE